MSSENTFVFTRDDIDMYLKEVAREYRKQVGKSMPAELILIGGASVLINYGFREITTDIDAVILAASAMKDAINRVGDRYALPVGWLNEDFKKTASYSNRLAQFSTYYKTYSNVLTIRTMAAEYLIAMKLRSGRQYKQDLSDVLGILAEHEKNGIPLTLEQIKRATIELYDSWDTLPETSRNFIENVIQDGHFEKLYAQARTGEKETRSLLLDCEQAYPGVTKGSNVDEIAENLQKQKRKASVLAQLREAVQSQEQQPLSEKKQKNRNEPER